MGRLRRPKLVLCTPDRQVRQSGSYLTLTEPLSAAAAFDGRIFFCVRTRPGSRRFDFSSRIRPRGSRAGIPSAVTSPERRHRDRGPPGGSSRHTLHRIVYLAAERLSVRRVTWIRPKKSAWSKCRSCVRVCACVCWHSVWHWIPAWRKHLRTPRHPQTARGSAATVLPTIHINLVLPAMSNPVAVAVARTAPIAIAPKPTIARSSIAPRRQDSLSSCGRSYTGRNPADLDSLRASSPCRSCKRTRAKCTMSEEDESCIPCQLNGSECSLVSSPQPRKRKLEGESGDEGAGKRRSVS